MDRETTSSHAPPSHSGNSLEAVDMASLSSQLGSFLRRALFGARLGNGRLGSGQLHLSISSSSSQPSIPIISETPSMSDGNLAATPSNVAATTTASQPLLPNSALVEAEAGVSRRFTHEEEMSNLAADAERLRLTSSTPISSLDVRQVARSMENALPFLILVFIVFFYHHFVPIAMFSLGTTLLHRANGSIQQQVARRGDLKRRKLISTALAVIGYATLLSVTSLRGKLIRILTLRGVSSSTQFWDVLFTVALSDLFIRFCLAFSKCIIVAVAAADTQAKCRRRGALITSIDYIVSVQRSMLPAPLWVRYFQNSLLPWAFAICLSALYLVVKAARVLELGSLAGIAAAQVRGGVHGTTPTVEEVAAAPRECAICQDDVHTPLRLVCGHIFCEDCVEEWLARESSCPMCRREVRRATLKPRGDGATSLFPFLC